MIAFGAPWALFGLIAASLPILLHLVQRREPPEVEFPAVRYLEDATRDHRRRLKLRHLLLLIVRTLLICAVVLAAARPTFAGAGVGAHAPSALVLVFDNSASSAAMVDGVPVLDALRQAARDVLAKASPADRLWLITAEGVARPGTAGALGAMIAASRSEPSRFDVSGAVSQGRDLIRAAGRPGDVVVLSDMQRTAIGGVRGSGHVLALRPDLPPPSNRSIAALLPGAQPWGPDGGRITVAVAGSDTTAAPVTIAVGARAMREVLVGSGAPVSQRIPSLAAGWTTISASLAPDELRLDDTRIVPLHVAPPAPVQWDPADRWISAALEVLAGDGRVRQGSGLRLGTLAPGPSLVLPPSDPAQAGALNRALAARGSAWRFGSVVVGSVRTDSGAILPTRELIDRRVVLERNGSSGEVLLTAGGDPWLVRSGDLLLLGSRLEPAWTGLPVSAAFVPFLDAIVTRVARGELVLPDVVAGAPTALPGRVTAVVHDGRRVGVEGGSSWRPRTLGVHYLLAGADTVGAVSTHIDPRESDLARATDAELRALWPGARVGNLERGPRLAFTAGGRGDLREALLIGALLLALGEILLAGRVTARS